MRNRVLFAVVGDEFGREILRGLGGCGHVLLGWLVSGKEERVGWMCGFFAAVLLCLLCELLELGNLGCGADGGSERLRVMMVGSYVRKAYVLLVGLEGRKYAISCICGEK